MPDAQSIGDWFARNPVESSTFLAAWIVFLDFLIRRFGETFAWLKKWSARLAVTLWDLACSPVRCLRNRAYLKRMGRLRFTIEWSAKNEESRRTWTALAREAVRVWRRTGRHPERYFNDHRARLWVWNVVRRAQFPVSETNEIMSATGGAFGPEYRYLWTPVRRFAVLCFLRTYAHAKRGINTPGAKYIDEPS